MADPTNEAIASLAKLGRKRDEFYDQAAGIAQRLGQDKADTVAKKMDKPTVTAAKAGVPDLKDGWPRLWSEAAIEILFQLSPDGLPPLLQRWAFDRDVYRGMVM